MSLLHPTQSDLYTLGSVLALLCAALSAGLPFGYHYTRQLSRGGWKQTTDVTLAVLLVGLQVFIHLAATTWKLDLASGYQLNIGSAIVFPLDIILLYYLCLAQRHKAFGVVAVAVVACNALLATLAFVTWEFGYGSSLPVEYHTFINSPAAYRMAVGAVVFAADIGFLVYFCRRFVTGLGGLGYSRVALPVVLTLVLDSFVYTAILRWIDGGDWGALLIGHLVGKAVAGLLYSIPLAAYMVTAGDPPAERVAQPVREFLAAVAVSLGLAWLTSGPVLPGRPTGSRAAVVLGQMFQSAAVSVTLDNGDGSAIDASQCRQCPAPTEGSMTGKYLNDIPTPDIVTEAINQAVALTPDKRARLEKQYKMSYLFGHLDVACQDTPDGTLILASGPSDEVAEYLGGLSDDEAAKVYVARPSPWDTLRLVRVTTGLTRS